LRLRDSRKEDPEINLISLIDVVLLLLIFFMMSSTFVEEGRMRVQLPTAVEEHRAGRVEPIVVTVGAQGSYRVNERELANSSRDTLRRAVAEVAGEGRDARVVLRADARATHQAVVTAMDVLGRMGFSQLDIATVQPDQGP
jgi:biopolymer transport protein ExbD